MLERMTKLVRQAKTADNDRHAEPAQKSSAADLLREIEHKNAEPAQKSSAADLLREIEHKKMELETKRAELASAPAKRKELLLNGNDDDLLGHDKYFAARTIECDRIEARIEQLTNDAEEEKGRDKEQARWDRYNANVVRTEKRRTWLIDRYPILNKEEKDGLAECRDLQKEREEINRDLPLGASPLDHIEVRFVILQRNRIVR